MFNSKNFMIGMIVLLIVASSLVLILSGKALRGDGIVWIYKALQYGVPHFDKPPYRLLGTIPQIPMIIFSKLSPNFTPSLLYVLYSTVLVIFYIAPVLYFLYRWIRYRDSFYLFPIFSFSLTCLTTDSYLVNLANSTGILAWLCIDLLRRAEKVRLLDFIILFTVLALSFSGYELIILMAPIYLVLLIKKFRSNIKNPLYFLLLFFVVIGTAFQVVKLLFILSNHSEVTNPYWISLGSGFNVTGHLIVAFLALYGLEWPKLNKKILLILRGLVVCLFFFVLNFNEVGFITTNVLDEGFNLRTYVLPIASALGLIYILGIRAPSLFLVSTSIVILASLSIFASMHYQRGLNLFEKKLLSKPCTMVDNHYLEQEYGLIPWTFTYISISMSQSKEVQHLLSVRENPLDKCLMQEPFYLNPHRDYIKFRDI